MLKWSKTQPSILVFICDTHIPGLTKCSSRSFNSPPPLQISQCPVTRCWGTEGQNWRQQSSLWQDCMVLLVQWIHVAIAYLLYTLRIYRPSEGSLHVYQIESWTTKVVNDQFLVYNNIIKQHIVIAMKIKNTFNSKSNVDFKRYCTYCD